MAVWVSRCYLANLPRHRNVTNVPAATTLNDIVCFLAALAALYLTLVSESVSQSVSDRHIIISTQRVSFET